MKIFCTQLELVEIHILSDFQRNLNTFVVTRPKTNFVKKSLGDFDSEGGGNREKFIRPFLCAIKFSISNLQSEFENSQKWPSQSENPPFPEASPPSKKNVVKMKSQTLQQGMAKLRALIAHILAPSRTLQLNQESGQSENPKKFGF